MKRRRLALVLAIGLAASARVSLAHADGDAASAAAAQKLFDEARALIASGRHVEACPKLKESQRLDPGVGTLLNLAECYEKIDKIASAWATYLEAESFARRSGQRERAAVLADRGHALGNKLSTATIKAVARTKGLSVRCDDLVLAEPTWGTPVPIDGGSHVIEATAPGYRPWRKTVRIGSTQDRLTVDVPPLEREPSTTPNPTGRGPSAQRIGGTILLGASAIAVATGFVFGALAKAKNDDAASHCTSVDCDARGVELVASARRSATASTVLVAAGATLAGAGVILTITAPHSPVRVTAGAGIGGGSVHVRW